MALKGFLAFSSATTVILYFSDRYQDILKFVVKIILIGQSDK